MTRQRSRADRGCCDHRQNPPYPYRPAYAELDPPTYKDEATGASVTVAPRARWEGEEWAFLGWLDTSRWTEGPARMALLWSGARPDELTTAYDDHGQVERQCWRCGRWSDAVQLNVVDVLGVLPAARRGDVQIEASGW